MISVDVDAQLLPKNFYAKVLINIIKRGNLAFSFLNLFCLIS